jgi:hypothetical protein
MVNCTFPGCGVKDGWLRKIGTCKYCESNYCYKHKSWENHFCPKKNSDWSDEKLHEELNKAEEQFERLKETEKSGQIATLALFGLGGLSGAHNANKIMKRALEKKIENYKKELERRKNK